MKITAETTDEQIIAPIEAARQALIKQCEDAQHTDAVTLQRYLNNVAAAEGAAQARYEYRSVLAFDQESKSDEDRHTQAAQHITGLLLNSTDDTVSGRTNDVRRAKHDGFREEVRRLVRGF